MQRRSFLTAAGLLATSGLGARAQDKPIRIIVAFAPGGPVDSVARVIAGPLGEALKRPVLVDNKPGANGVIGAQDVLRAPADGSTLWLSSVGAAAINASLYPNLPYDMARDFAPVSLVVNNVEVLVVNADNKAKTAAEFVANAKASGKEVPMASSGVGSVPHLAIEQLASTTGAKFLHVPYKGAAPALTDLMGGRVDGFFGDVPGLIGFVKAGRLRAIGVAAAHRHPSLPDVPTFEEQGLGGVDTNNWYGLFVKAGTPEATIASLNQAVRTALAATSEKLLALGAEPAPSTSGELAALVKSDTTKWGALIKAKGITGE
ncbi:MAG: tripartite tricarboxylate transporter substrate binding protein [Acetobacteraceae bacterium]|nr:tripartite tricarboxylate transporter substrate binding protein [Acetobacteraceae bacterium]